MVFILDPDEEDAPVRAERCLRYIDEQRSRELQQLTEEFLANGGAIELVPTVVPLRPAPYRVRRTQEEYEEAITEVKPFVDSDKDRHYRDLVLRAVQSGVVGYKNCAARTGLSERIILRIADKYNIRVKRVTKKEMCHE